MDYASLSARLSAALKDSGLSPAALAIKSGATEATISNWLNDKVQVDHVKAAMLLRICKVLGVSPTWLLLGEGSRGERWAAQEEASHPVKQATLTVALQLVTEALDEKQLTLPPSKRAELTALVYDLLEEGVPEAKVLRFARAAA